MCPRGKFDLDTVTWNHPRLSLTDFLRTPPHNTTTTLMTSECAGSAYMQFYGQTHVSIPYAPRQHKTR